MQRHKMVLVRVNAGEYAAARRLAEMLEVNVQDLVRTLLADAAREAGIKQRPTVDPRQLQLRSTRTT
jgi:antitoxin component of RelBE/YafQ-DinJ toxin-antitoxin module